MIHQAPFDRDVAVVCSVGNQPNPTVIAMKVIGAALSRVVLVHGGSRSADVAKTVERYLRIHFPAVRVDSIGLSDPFTSAAIGEVREKVLPVLGGRPLAGWQLLYGPGTASMNVALAALWIVEQPQNVWSLSTRDLLLTNGGGASLPVPIQCRLDIVEQVEMRTGSLVERDSAQPNDAPLNRGERIWVANWIQSWSRQPIKRAGPTPANQPLGDLFERTVRDVLSGLVGAGAVVNRGVRLTFPEGGQRREIDVVVEDVDSGRLTVVSCAQRKGFLSKDRTHMRNKANEVRTLAGNLFGSECQSLAVILNTIPLMGRAVVDTVRHDGIVRNGLTERHWVVSAQELLGSRPEAVLRTFDEPASVLERLPDLRRWLIGE